jgi:chemotaxis protein CheD
MTVSNDTTIMVGLGEVKISQDPESVLACLGLGSCVAISAFDPVAKIGGMAHVVLPASNGRIGERAGRYADIAVPLLFETLREKGAADARLVINLVGGAQMSLAAGIGTAFKIGEHNVTAVCNALEAEGLNVNSLEVGGSKGRTVRLFIDSGKAVVASAGQESREL